MKLEVNELGLLSAVALTVCSARAVVISQNAQPESALQRARVGIV
jgi:hypothetical protein